MIRSLKYDQKNTGKTWEIYKNIYSVSALPIAS